MRRASTLVCFLAFVGLVVALAVLPGCGDSSDSVMPDTTDTIDSHPEDAEESSSPLGDTEIITKAEYDQIVEGMTYEESVEIIGGEGKLLKEAERSDGSTTTLIYYWKGNGGAASQAELSFEDGKLIYRLQSGLQ